MSAPVLGRTNTAFPSIWLSLSTPADASKIAPLVEAAKEAQTPIDISSQPALWGGLLRNQEATLMSIARPQIETATEHKHAYDLVQAHLIETLCAIGRETLDLYFLRLDRALEEFQIAGALEAIEMARQEGHIRFVGLYVAGPAIAVLTTWHFHDAFDLALVPRNRMDQSDYELIKSNAESKRVGLVTCRSLNWGHGIPFMLTQSDQDASHLACSAVKELSQDHPVLVGVRSADEVQALSEAPKMTLPSNWEEIVANAKEAYANEEFWTSLLDHDTEWVRRSAERRSRVRV